MLFPFPPPVALFSRHVLRAVGRRPSAESSLLLEAGTPHYCAAPREPVPIEEQDPSRKSSLNDALWRLETKITRAKCAIDSPIGARKKTKINSES